MPSEKNSFAVERKLEAFYSHGKLQPSVDGKYLLCCSGSKVNFFNTETGTIEFYIEKEDETEIFCFKLSSDDKILITANKELILRQWSVIDKKLIRSWKTEHKGPIVCLAFDISLTLLASASADSTVKIWDLEKQYCTNLLRKHQGVVSLIIFNPKDSYQLFSTSDDYIIRCFNLKNHACIFELSHHHSLITALQFTADSKYLYSCSRDTTVVKWNLDDMTKKSIAIYESIESLLLINKTINLPFKSEHDNEYIIVAGNKGSISFWNATKGICEYKLPKIGEGSIKNEKINGIESDVCILQLEYAGENIFVATSENNFVFYDAIDFKICKQFIGRMEHVTDVKFLGIGKEDTHFILCTNSNQLKLYNLATMSCQIYCGHKDIILAVDIVRIYGGCFAATASKDNTIILWKLLENGELCMLCCGEGHTHNVTTISFMNLSTKDDCESIFLVSGSVDQTIKLWKSTEIAQKTKKKKLNSETEILSFDQRDLVVKLTLNAHDKDINSIAISPDHKIVATASEDKTAKLWNRMDFSLNGILKGHKRGIWSVVFSQIDKIVATSSADTTIKLWDVINHNCLKTFEGHESSVLRVRFLSHGMQLISCGSDGLVKLWRIRTNECIKTIDAHDDKIWCLDLSIDEQLLITAAGDVVSIWRDTSEEETALKNQAIQDVKLKEQELSNLLKAERYVEALQLAITLNQPLKALNIIKKLMNLTEDEYSNALINLRDDQIESLLQFCLIWNQNARNCHAAHFILNFFLKQISPDKFLSFSNIRSLVEGLIPYTERHLNRLNELHIKSSFLAYLCDSFQETNKLEEDYIINSNNAMDVISN